MGVTIRRNAVWTPGTGRGESENSRGTPLLLLDFFFGLYPNAARIGQRVPMQL